MDPDQYLHPAYFETHFQSEVPDADWPANFAVITAYATTGEQWSIEANQTADRRLEIELRKTGQWLQRLTGYAPGTAHAEPGWAVELPLEAACEIGSRFKQDAIYFVSANVLFVTFCDSTKKGLVEVGSFRERLGRHRESAL